MFTKFVNPMVIAKIRIIVTNGSTGIFMRM